MTNHVFFCLIKDIKNNDVNKYINTFIDKMINGENSGQITEIMKIFWLMFWNSVLEV